MYQLIDNVSLLWILVIPQELPGTEQALVTTG